MGMIESTNLPKNEFHKARISYYHETRDCTVNIKLAIVD